MYMNTFLGYCGHVMRKDNWRRMPYKDMFTEEDRSEDKGEDGLKISRDGEG